MDDPDPGSKTTPARASPLKRYVPQRKRADGTFENSNMGGSVHLIAPDPVERAAHRASIRSQLPPAITRPPPSTEYGRSCVKLMETELLQKILNIERNATNREAKERRAQGLKVSDDDDDAKWIAAGFENWPEKRFDDLLVSMDRRHAEAGARFEARRKERRDEFTKEKGRTPNDDAEVDVWFEARREARRKKRVSLRLDAFIEENGRSPNDDAEFDEWKAAIDAARNTKATTNFMSKLKQYYPDVPTDGWLVEVFDRRLTDGRLTSYPVYTPPSVLAGERTDVKAPSGGGLRGLSKVWPYCEARWGAALLRVVSARDAAATTNFISLFKQKYPDVPTDGWRVEVSDRRRLDQCDGTRAYYTTPPMLAGERTDIKAKRGIDTLPKVWAYCEARWGAPVLLRVVSARDAKATTNFMSKLKQYNPDVPTVGWLVEVFDVSGSSCKQTRNVYTPPPVLAGERTDVKIKRGKRGLRSLPDVWAYCEARWGAPTTVKAPVKRQMTLGFAVAPKKPRVE